MIQLVLQSGFLDFITNDFNCSKKVRADFEMFLECTASPTTIYSDCNRDELIQFRYKGKTNEYLQLLGNTKVFKVKSFNMLDEILTSDFINDGFVFKMFFIDANAQTCNELRAKYGFAFFCKDNFEVEWMKYYCQRNRAELTMPVDATGFNEWNKLELLKHTFITAIIIDPFLLNEKETLETNINELIKSLIAFENIDCMREIILITTDNKNKELSDDTWQERFNIVSKLKSLFPKVDFYLFRYPSKCGDHERGIYTNYWFIKSGTSFNFANKSGNIKDAHDDITSHMNFYKGTLDMLTSRMKDAEAYVIFSIDEPITGILQGKKRRFSTKPIPEDYMPALIKTIKSFSE
jgi:hypothetical protein